VDIEAKNERSLATLARVITLSQQQFALILVRCNYVQVRDRMAEALQNRLDFPIQTLPLPETAKTLYTTIHKEIESPPPALMIFGLEQVQDLDQALIATNIVREELRKQFQFPLVLWINDAVLRQLERLAPDLSSWAGNTIIEFEMAIPELVRSLKHHSDRLFSSALSLGDEQFWAIWQLPPPNSLRPDELQFAMSDLQASQYAITGELQASLDFLLAQTAHSQGELETARELYEQSLAFWMQHLEAGGRGQEAGGRGQGEAGEDEKGEEPDPSLPLTPSPPSSFPPSSPLTPIPYLERAACLLFCLGLWWRSYAVLQRAAYRRALQRANEYFRQSLALFSQENRQDLVARFIAAQSETLQKLEDWDQLELVSKQSLVLHKLYKDPVREARDRGFLAEVAIARSQWETAKREIETALQILDQADDNLHQAGHPPDPHLENTLDLAHRYHYSWYLFVLAKAEQALGSLDTAIHYLEVARDQSHPQNDPPLYIQILSKLRDAYYEKGEYHLAFRTRQARRLIEHQYGYRAFVGALRLQPQEFATGSPLPLPAQIDQQRLLTQELEASGRQKDLNTLIARLSQAQYKLIVIHGPSGVGKSSILNAGLFPLLQDHTVEGRIPLPLLLDFYNDWESGLGQGLQRGEEEGQEADFGVASTMSSAESSAQSNEGRGQEASFDVRSQSNGVRSQEQFFDPGSSPSLSDRLKETTDRNRLPILLLDQFEEFFFTYPTVQERLPFYRFLGICLKLPFVKIVLSLREDYLHYLLEFQRYADLDIINNDILGKQIRYPLGDLTPEDARAVISSLTQKAQFYLPDDLIDALVQDLAGDLGEVRPIELQVVGAQLQAEGIDTLAKYRQKGPKEKLVQRSLEEVVQDCGPENADLARIILFLLTNENGTRPLKTHEDLEADLVDLGLTQAIACLDLVLEVLVGSGLVFLIPEAPANYYQLVHDYLVDFIRQDQEPEVGQLQAELQREREQRRYAEANLRTELQQRLQAEAQLREAQEQQMQFLRKQLWRSQISLMLSVLMFVTLLIIGGLIWRSTR
jgi:tetratricopeptide (TPR) repeat protein